MASRSHVPAGVGLGRAGMAGARLLREAGLSADEVVRHLERARHGALVLPDQQAYLRRAERLAGR